MTKKNQYKNHVLLRSEFMTFEYLIIKTSLRVLCTKECAHIETCSTCLAQKNELKNKLQALLSGTGIPLL